MLLFLLPLLFNPFSMIVNWLPGLYLAAWPIIIQTLGRETLVTHALVLILFILTCDITRQMMLKTIGFDLLSFPLGIALLLALTTGKGATFLSLIKPIFGGLLVIVEPAFLVIEIYLFMDMLKSFNRWISTLANVRDDDSQDLSSWEPPLTRGAVIARIFIILITIFSYIGVYLIIQESKSLLGTGSDIPVNFNHAIAALVTLQVLAFSATIYKEEGVLSESALVALLASIPIFIASWSYYHLKETSDASR